MGAAGSNESPAGAAAAAGDSEAAASALPLPEDALVEVLSFLPMEDLARVRAVSKELKETADADVTLRRAMASNWRMSVEALTKLRAETAPDADWLSFYKMQCKHPSPAVLEAAVTLREMPKAPEDQPPRATASKARSGVLIAGAPRTGKSHLSTSMHRQATPEGLQLHPEKESKDDMHMYWGFLGMNHTVQAETPQHGAFSIHFMDIMGSGMRTPVRTINTHLAKRSDTIILCFAADDPSSVEEAELHYNNVMRHLDDGQVPPHVILAATKCDKYPAAELEHNKVLAAGRRLAEKHDLSFHMTSSRTGMGLHNLMREAAFAGALRNPAKDKPLYKAGREPPATSKAKAAKRGWFGF